MAASLKHLVMFLPKFRFGKKSTYIFCILLVPYTHVLKSGNLSGNGKAVNTLH